MAPYKTSFTPNEERFGFKETGTIHCANKAEALVFIGVTAILIFVLIIIILLYSGIAVGGLDVIYGYFLPIGVAFLAYGSAIVLIRMGHKFRYDANSEYMDIIPESKDLSPQRIYYTDVDSVEYEPFKLFGSVRGLKVTIKVKGNSVEYRCIYPKFQITNNIDKYELPFYIIEERAELAKKNVHKEEKPES